MPYAQMEDPAFDDRYACSVYAHVIDVKRFVLVCESTPLPDRFVPRKWRLVAYGIQPPDRAKPWLKLNGFYEIFFYGE